MRKKVLSLVMTVAIVFGFFDLMPEIKAEAKFTANEIVARADELYNLTWTPLKNVYGYGKNNTFYAGESYHIPYGMPVKTGTFIGYDIGVYDFISETKNSNSKLYTSSSGYNASGYQNAWYCPYYAMDCSTFVSYCWGLSTRNTTSGLPSYSRSLGKCNSSNVNDIRVGDALNSSGHVVLVTRISGDNIEITEETPPQLKRTTYSKSQIVNKYSAYTILRYADNAPVPINPPNSANITTDKGSYMGHNLS